MQGQEDGRFQNGSASRHRTDPFSRFADPLHSQKRPCPTPHRLRRSVTERSHHPEAADDASRIATAVSCYGDYRDEIDTEISDADEASARAEEAWRVQRQLIA
jgi:hypothetical protein